MAKWTNAQQRVIQTRNKNLLVSAAAGSGKTAVLVERIISMISEGEQPVDIDHLLVVTFTNAAAAQMRERIGKALEKKLLKEPGNTHLQKQLSLLQSAQITTIHSFCLNVIRNYFHRIDLDPSFKMTDESDITLMQSDVMGEVLERWYEEGREDFHEFVESYSYSKSDIPVEELVLQLYRFSMSNPWPKEWIDKLKVGFRMETLEELENTDWMQELLQYLKVVLRDLIKKNKTALSICNEADGPAAYIPAMVSDRALLNQLMDVKTYSSYGEKLSQLTFERLSSKREEVDPAKRDRVKGLRDEIKKGVKDLTNQFFFQSPEEMLSDLMAVNRCMSVLFDLTIDFMEEFSKKKEEKNLIDFNDLEHFALNILVETVDGVKSPTAAALELSEFFEEILIDEYQDSNLVQETLLRSISRELQGAYNRFMVGDVKQSIYKFRLAMPELFMEKFRNYSTKDYLEDGSVNKNLRIDLDKNFRSRKVVLDYVNQIFEQIMTEAVGGIIYDEEASLKYGELFEELLEANIAENAQRISSDVELLLVTDEELKETRADDASGLQLTEDNTYEEGQELLPGDTEESPDEAVYTKKELEARAIAARIRELVDHKTGLMLFDRETMSYRTAAYRDVVILLRSMSGWSEVFVNTLMQEGIPAYADTGSGYFQTVEIMTVLNLLRIIDNPSQDIPFVGVLYSPMVGLSSNELAMIRLQGRSLDMYQAACSYVKANEDELKEKLESFLSILNDYRAKVKYTPINELIQELLDRTGYYYYVMAMPGGERRIANIDQLIRQAVQFEKGSYSGLFHFIRYMEKLNRYEIDFGEASTISEQDNTVRIMSIHKSKGLEFPIVVVAGLSKQFNTQDLRSSMVIHSDYGVGPDYVDVVKRTKLPTLRKRVLQKKIQMENLGEELRVLYVAMTRAKEKLILSGYIKNKDELKGKEFSFYELMSSKSYLELVMPAMLNHMYENELTVEYPGIIRRGGMVIKLLHRRDLTKQELEKQFINTMEEQELRAISPEAPHIEELREEIRNILSFSYPHIQTSDLKVKLSVSELKRLGQEVPDFPAVIPETNAEKPGLKTVPGFIRDLDGSDITTSGTDRGTLYHKVLELLDLTVARTRETVLSELERMVSENRLKDSELKSLRLEGIIGFALSPIAERMRKAQAEGRLYKEQQFVMGISAKELYPEQSSEELILVQGIIDIFFEEESELVLLDYKSDIVENSEQLIKRYQVQLKLYKRALEQILGKKVKQIFIYSLYLGKEISCGEL